jgi:hypothetical protein
VQIERLDDTRLAGLADKDRVQLLQARELGEFGDGVHGMSFSVDFFQCDAALAGLAAAILRNSGTNSVAITKAIMMARNASA